MGLNFFVEVCDDSKQFSVPVPEELVDSLSDSRVLSLTDALSLGLDVSQIVDENGQRVEDDATIEITRCMNALTKGELIEEEGERMVPTLSVLRAKAGNPEIVQALRFFENIAAGAGEKFTENADKCEVLPMKIEPFKEDVVLSPVSGVYLPTVESIEKYIHNQAKKSDNDFPSASYAEQIVAMCKLFRAGGTLYQFVPDFGYYVAMDRNALMVLIDKNAGKAIRQANKSKAYGEIEKFLCSDYRLEVTENHILSLHFWVFKNGILDVATKTFSANDGRFFIRTALNCQFLGVASCPVFESFLTAATGGNSGLQKLIWQVLGYVLSPDTYAKSFFSFVGPKDTGKSLLADVFTAFFPDNAISLLAPNDFSGKFDVSELKDKRLNLCMDLPDVPLSQVAVAKIKSITGGDIIRSDRKYQSAVTFRTEGKLLFGSNSLLRTERVDIAFNDREVMIPFCYPIPKDRQDKNLLKKIVNELSGIAFYAMEAYLRLVSNNYVFEKVDFPEDFGKPIDYEEVILDFAKEECNFTDSSRISTSDLYNAFANFCMLRRLGVIEKNDFSQRFNRAFGNRVTKKKIKMQNASVWGYVGVTLGRRENVQPTA